MLMIPSVIERNNCMGCSFDIYSRLLRDRIIFLCGTVTDEMANLVIAQMLYLDSENPKLDIYLYINSLGGSITAGMAIYDTMRSISAPVSTIADGARLHSQT